MAIELNPAFFEHILDQLRGDIAVLDKDHRYMYVNPYAVSDPEMRKWIIGKTDFDYCKYRGLDTKIAEERSRRFKSVMETGQSTEWEEYFVDKNGNPRAFLRRLSPVLDVDGSVMHLIGHGLDVTDRWKLGLELYRSQELFAGILQVAPGPVYLKNQDGCFLMLNDALADLYQRDPKLMIGLRQSEIHPVESEMRLIEQQELRAIETGLLVRAEESFTRSDGSVVWLDTIRMPLIQPDYSIQILGFSTDITERKNKEDLLIESERKLNEAQEVLKSGNYEMKIPSLELTWSKGMYLIWEIDIDTPPDLDLFYKHLHPDDFDVVRKAQSEMQPGNEPWIITYRIITPKGNTKHIEAHSRYTLDPLSGNFRLIGSCVDVTDKVAIEEKLRFSEQRLIEAQEIANSGSWEIYVEPELRIHWSPGMYKIFERDQSLGAPLPDDFYANVFPEDRDMLIRVIDDLIESGEPVDCTFRYKTQSGEQKILFCRGRSGLESAGKIMSVYGTTTDITAQKNTEERLRSSENDLLLAQRIARIGSWSFDQSTRSASWSPGVYSIYERDNSLPALNAEEMMARIHPDDRELLNVKPTDIPSSVEDEKMVRLRVITDKGKWKYIEVRFRQMLVDSGGYRFFGTIMDITDKKLAEDELLRAKNQAEELLKSKENFLANISHELRTPLNGILGMVRLIQKSSLNNAQREYVNVLQHTAGNLLVIINDILDFTKLESGHYTFEESLFNPAVVADTAIQLEMIKAEEKGLVLRHLHIGDTPMPLVLGDPHRLSQVLLNLLNNAIKFTNSGEVVLTHSVLQIDGEKVKVGFAVKDTGIGIPSNMHQRIFESFTQVNTSEFGSGGVGLGLTITRGLIEKQGGSISVKSAPDEGSLFSFEITYKLPDAASLEKEKNSSSVNLKGLKMLVVEDNKVNLFITESMMQSWGVEVDTAFNGEEAFRMASENTYDLILMDIQMPMMDGLEATRRIRNLRNFQRANVPIVAVTANTSRLAQKKLLADGMNDFLVKPFKEEALFKKITINLPSAQTENSKRFPRRRSPVKSAVREPSGKLYDLSLLIRDEPANADFIRKMLVIFLDTIPASVDSMQQFMDLSDYDSVSSIAHKIKPTLEGTGIVSLKDTIRNLELYRDKKRKPRQMQDDIEHLKSVITEVAKELRQEIERLGRPEDSKS